MQCSKLGLPRIPGPRIFYMSHQILGRLSAGNRRIPITATFGDAARVHHEISRGDLVTVKSRVLAVSLVINFPVSVKSPAVKAADSIWGWGNCMQGCSAVTCNEYDIDSSHVLPLNWWIVTSMRNRRSIGPARGMWYTSHHTVRILYNIGIKNCRSHIFIYRM